jgi:hypothetical protein
MVSGPCPSAKSSQRHLITLDENLRVVLSKSIRDHFTSESVRMNFQPYEGQRISVPHRFTPDTTPLRCHRDLFSKRAALAGNRTHHGPVIRG